MVTQVLALWMTVLTFVVIVTAVSQKERINTCRDAQAGEKLYATIEKPGETRCVYSQETHYGRSQNKMRSEKP